MNKIMKTKITNSIICGMAAYMTLLVIVLWFSGLTEHFTKTIIGFFIHFAIITFIACIIGGIFNPTKKLKTIICGSIIGLVGGSSIALYVVSQI